MPTRRRHRRHPRPLPVRLLLAGLLAVVLTPHNAARSAEDWALCARAADMAETLRPDLPPHLLDAIAKVESGRWHDDPSARIAWPWTVTAEGEGRYLPTKAAALRLIRDLKSRGTTNIDVGCMQVNMHYHGHAFDTPEQALDPAINMAYAAEFLLKLHRQRGSWTRAIGDYHSQTPRYSGKYRLKVFRAWRAEKKAAYARAVERRRERSDASRNRRAE